MTPRERVIAAVRHQMPDRTPTDFGGMQFSCCEPGVLRNLRELLGFSLAEDRDADGVWPDERIQQYLGVDLRWIPGRPPLAVSRDRFPREYEEEIADRRRPQAEPGLTEFPLARATGEEIRAIRPKLPEPSVFLPWHQELARRYRERGFATTMSVCAGFFEMGCWQRGYDQFALDLAADPDLVRHLFDVWLEEKRRIIETLVRPMAPLIDIFVFGDDLGMQTGTFMSIAMFREIVKPCIGEFYRMVHEAAPQSFLLHHSCGSVYSYLDDFIEVGIDILNPIQPNARDMQPEKLKERGRGRLCFHGGVDLQQLLPRGTPQQVRAETVRRQQVLGEGGGYICAPAHIVPEDVPVANILALYGGLSGHPAPRACARG